MQLLKEEQSLLNVLREDLPPTEAADFATKKQKIVP